jgi:hypothetical protein
MSTPNMQLKTSLMGEAFAEDVPRPQQQIKVTVPVPDMGQTEAVVEVPPDEAPPPAHDNATTIGLLPLWAVAIVWVIGIVLWTQGAKAALKAVGLKDRLNAVQWQRWMLVVPLFIGIAQALLVGPTVARAFEIDMDRWTAVVFIGGPSGAAAPWVYLFFRRAILPLLGPTALGLIEKVTGLTMPDEVRDKVNDSGLFNSPSEAVDTFDAETPRDRPGPE